MYCGISGEVPKFWKTLNCFMRINSVSTEKKFPLRHNQIVNDIG